MSGKTTSPTPPSDEPEIIDSLPDELKDLDGVPPEVVARMMVSIKRSWSGPYPPPDILKQYPKEIQKAIIAQANSQSKHRQSLEKQVVASNIKNSSTGMSYGFWITVLLIGAGVFLISHGKSAEGLLTILAPSAFHGGNFIVQKWREWREVATQAAEENDKSVSKINHKR